MLCKSQSFHSQLSLLKNPSNYEYLENLAFFCSVLSPVRTREDVLNDISIKKCNWMLVFSLASRWMVAPLLLSRIRQKQLVEFCPNDFLDALCVFYDANMERNRFHRDIFLESIALLNKNNIYPILLKGSHALIDKLPDSQERVISDIDLLIPSPKDLRNAKHIFLENDYYNENNFSYSWAKDFNLDTSYHHLKPLFHPSGLGYLELHRFPNYAPYYEELMDDFFNYNSMLFGELEGVKFYYGYPEQILLYNQIHHYHSVIKSFRGLDIRHLSEQASILNSLDEPCFLIDLMNKNFSKNNSWAFLQFKLMEDIFGCDITHFEFGEINNSDKKIYSETLKKLSGDKLLSYRIKIARLANHASNIFKDGNLKRRIFNLKWYYSRPKAIYQILKY